MSLYECHNCANDFEAEQDVRGECPHCHTRYDWHWEGGVWSEEETCCIMFDTEPEEVKRLFLSTRDWI